MTQTLTEAVAAEVRAEMARQQKQQGDLARHLRVTQATISRRLAGKASFRIEDLQEIATFLNVPVSSFFSKVAA